MANGAGSGGGTAADDHGADRGDPRAHVAEDHAGELRSFLAVVLGLIGLILAGWGVIAAVDAIENDPDCGSYGYGGYGYGGDGGYGCEPPGPDATIVVEPSTDLVDRQTVTLTGSGFDPNTQFGAAQCDEDLALELQSPSACDLSTSRLGSTDSDGNITLTLQVRRIIVVQGVEIDCAVENCIIGAATLGPDLFTPIEGVGVPISFDPSVPPVPRLHLELTVDDVTARGATGTATCNRDAQLFVDLSISQTKGRDTVTAFGYTNEPLTCSTDPTEWNAILFGGSGLTGGPATYNVFGSAYDGFESASTQVSGETRLSVGPRPPIVPIDTPGETVSVAITGTSGRGEDLAIDLLVTCDRPVDAAYVGVDVTQWAGREQVSGYGNAELDGCDGETPVSVPVTSVYGVLAGGPAQVRAFAYVQDFDDGFFFDSASAVDAVTLHGAIRPPVPALEPNPDSRVAIDVVTTSSLSGTVRCEEPARVSLWSSIQQAQGRTIRTAFGYGDIACDGETAFDLPLEGDLSGGPAGATVYADAYRIVDTDTFPFYEYLWSDYQAAEVRLRG